MKTSMNLSCGIRLFGEKRAIELYSKAGFSGYDFSFNSFVDACGRENVATPLAGHPFFGPEGISYAKELRRIADDSGIECLSSHAPHPSDGLGMMEYLKWSLEITEILGGKIVVIHPCCRTTIDVNTKMYRELLPIAKAHGLKIATENMWDWNHDKEHDHAIPCACSLHDNFLAHLNAIDDEDFVACLDFGHAEMRGLDTSAIMMARTLGKKIEILHIHDNDKWHDDHAAPFTGKIDFLPIMKELRAVGYSGDITLEIAQNQIAAPTEEESFCKLSALADAAARLRDMFLNA